MQSMDHSVPTSYILGSYGDLSQGHYLYQHHQELLCSPPSASATCLYNAGTQEGSHWTLGNAILTHTRVGSGLLYASSCTPLAGHGAAAGSGALAETNTPSISISRPYSGMRNMDFRTQGRNTHNSSREEAQQREDSQEAHKKKNGRPTFSGYQIYVLEKAFEQNKYLSSMEKQRLALSLGMTDSQVKVWFQNRRTKWRKTAGSEPEKTRVKPAHERHQLSGDFDKPLDPNNEDDWVQMLLQRHGCTNRDHNCSQLLALQMATTDQAMNTRVSQSQAKKMLP